MSWVGGTSEEMGKDGNEDVGVIYLQQCRGL